MKEVRPVLDIPIFHKIYELYKLLHSYHNFIPKSQCYTLWQKCENTTLVLLEALIESSHQYGEDRLRSLYHISNKLDLLKVLIRLAKETHTVDLKQYLAIQGSFRKRVECLEVGLRPSQLNRYLPSFKFFLRRLRCQLS